MMDYRVEKRFSPHGDVEGDVQVGLVAASVILHVSNGWHLAIRFLNSFALGKYFLLQGPDFMILILSFSWSKSPPRYPTPPTCRTQ